MSDYIICLVRLLCPSIYPLLTSCFGTSTNFTLGSLGTGNAWRFPYLVGMMNDCGERRISHFRWRRQRIQGFCSIKSLQAACSGVGYSQTVTWQASLRRPSATTLKKSITFKQSIISQGRDEGTHFNIYSIVYLQYTISTIYWRCVFCN